MSFSLSVYSSHQIVCDFFSRISFLNPTEEYSFVSFTFVFDLKKILNVGIVRPSDALFAIRIWPILVRDELPRNARAETRQEVPVVQGQNAKPLPPGAAQLERPTLAIV